MIRNVHARRLPVQACVARAALGQLATELDRVWPSGTWPSLQLDSGLTPGSAGGHGPIRYQLALVDDRSIVFEFGHASGFTGTHRFDVRPDGLACEVVHTIEMRAAGVNRLRWALAVRWLHDALLEDLLDELTRAVGAAVRTPARWSPYVRLLRRTFRITGSRASSRDRKLRSRDVVQHDVEVVVVGR